jgi:hypothetical protein
MFKIRSYELYTFYNAGAEPKHGYGVTPYTQPLHRWLIGQVYHWYDMRIFKVPGFKLVERIYGWWNLKVRKLEPWHEVVPLGVAQDLKCFYLTRKGREELKGFEISVEDYKKLGGLYAREDGEDAERQDGGPVQEIRGSDPAAPTP